MGYELGRKKSVVKGEKLARRAWEVRRIETPDWYGPGIEKRCHVPRNKCRVRVAQ